MENPIEDIPGVMRSLCQGNRAEQTAVLESHFLPDASFLHPFCRVPSFLAFPAPCMRVQSRQVILAIYRWYRLLSPRIELCIDSCAFDDKANVLYVSFRQTFCIRFIPMYEARVRGVTVLRLHLIPASTSAADPEGEDVVDGEPGAQAKYRIAEQEDHYQVDEFVKFLLPLVGPLVCFAWQCISTVVCLMGVAAAELFHVDF